MFIIIIIIIIIITLCLLSLLFVIANGNNTNNNEICPRFAVGSVVSQPVSHSSENGILKLALFYRNRTDETFGNQLFCYMDSFGNQSPLLRVNPGDSIWITLTNQVSSSSSTPTNSRGEFVDCGGVMMDETSVNIHFHGMSVSPSCHMDDVINVIVNSGESFVYQFNIPENLSPGLYAYHDHVHGMSDVAVLGGASAPLIVQGIENFQPLLAGLPERVLVLRDYNVPIDYYYDTGVPAWDISLNYVPIPFPNYSPAIISMQNYEQKEFWRVVNAGSDTIFYIQILYDGVPQALQVVAFDAVPINSQDGTNPHTPTTLEYTEIMLPPYQRVEFIVVGPSSSVKNATFVTLFVETGPDGDYDPFRPLANIAVNPNSNSGLGGEDLYVIPNPTNNGFIDQSSLRFGGLATADVSQNRYLYFSEVLLDPTDPSGPTVFFITVEGQTPVAFNSSQPPAITATQGTAEDWIIENRALENHVFHIHQVHFLLLERNGIPVSKNQQQYLDVIQIPFWSGNVSDSYPSVKVRLDFRGADVGEFVYHCHILGHEDNGMMAKIQVVMPFSTPSQTPNSSYISQYHWPSNYHRNLTAGMVFFAVVVVLSALIYYYQLHNSDQSTIFPTNGGKLKRNGVGGTSSLELFEMNSDQTNNNNTTLNDSDLTAAAAGASISDINSSGGNNDLEANCDGEQQLLPVGFDFDGRYHGVPEFKHFGFLGFRSEHLSSSVEQEVLVPNENSEDSKWINWKTLWAYTGPSFIITMAYLDPGNLEADLQAGAYSGYSLLWVLLWATVMGYCCQVLALRLGVVTNLSLSDCCAMQYPRWINMSIWFGMELAAIGNDIQAIIGVAIALQVLFDLPLFAGSLISAFTAALMLVASYFGVRKLESIVGALVGTMVLCFWIQYGYATEKSAYGVKISSGDVAYGTIVPSMKNMYILIAVALFGGTVEPCNLFLHSAIVRTRQIDRSSDLQIRKANKYYAIETGLSIGTTFLINLALLSVFAATYYNPECANQGEALIKHKCDEVGLENAGDALKGVFGKSAVYLWAIGLLAAGQATTITNTLAGQYIMEGFINIKVSQWKRVVLTRSIALVPALLVSFLAQGNASAFNVLSEWINVIQNIALPFSLLPLIHFNSQPRLMKRFALGVIGKICYWAIGIFVVLVNFYLMFSFVFTPNVAGSDGAVPNNRVFFAFFGAMVTIYIVILWSIAKHDFYELYYNVFRSKIMASFKS